MTTCKATTTVEGKTVDCEHEADHPGLHEGHIPDHEKVGLAWDIHRWGE